LALLGSSGTGKSVLISEILNNFTTCTGSESKPTVIYCYKTELPSGLLPGPNVYVYRGLPNLKNVRLQFAKEGHPVVIVFDDLLSGKFKFTSFWNFKLNLLSHVIQKFKLN